VATVGIATATRTSTTVTRTITASSPSTESSDSPAQNEVEMMLRAISGDANAIRLTATPGSISGSARITTGPSGWSALAGGRNESSTSRNTGNREEKESKARKEAKRSHKQKPDDWKFRADKLLHLILERLHADSTAAVKALLAEQKSGKDIVTIPAGFRRIHPCAKLLWHLQCDLFKKASLKKEQGDSSEAQILSRYIEKLISMSSELLKLARPMLEVISDEGSKTAEAKEKESKEKDGGDVASQMPKGNTDSGATPQKGDSDSKKKGLNDNAKSEQKTSENTEVEMVPLFEAVLTVLFNGLTGDITLMGLMVLYSCVLHPVYGCDMAEKMVESVNHLLLSVDGIISSRIEKSIESKHEKRSIEFTAESEYKTQFEKASRLHANPVVVESPHTYFTSEQDKIVTIPGATHLSLEFDPRCSTESRRDFLSVTTPSGEHVCDELHGRPDAWPEVPVIVQGDTVIFRFRADSFNNYFGYRCLVSGLYLFENQAESKDAEKVDEKKGTAKKKTAKKKKKRSAAFTRASGAAAVREEAVPAATPARAAGAAAVATTPGAAATTTRSTTPAPASATGSDSKNNPETSNAAPSGDSSGESAYEELKEVDDAEAKGGKQTSDGNEDEEEKEDEDEDEEEDDFLLSVELGPDNPPMRWLVDLARTTSHTLGRCLRSLSVGAPVELMEKRAHRWLASPLFAGEAEFKSGAGESGDPADVNLSDLIENRKGTTAANLHAHMKKLVGRKMHDVLGGEVVQKTVRSFIAVLLKHLGLVSVAEEYAHDMGLVADSKKPGPQSNILKDPVFVMMQNKLQSIWTCAQNFHLTISTGYSAHKMAFFAREEKMKETKEQWDEEELKEQKVKLTWEGFVGSINDRCRLLLSQQPFFEASNSVRALLMTPPRLTRVSSAYKPSTGGSVHKSLTSLYSAFDVVNSSSRDGLDDNGEAPTVDEQQEAVEQLTDIVMQFLSAPNPVSEFKRMRKIHQDRARHRANSVRILRTALETVKVPSCCSGVLASWGTPFRQYSAYPRSEVEKLAPRGSHYLRNVESSGPKLITAIHDEVTSLYRFLAEIIRGKVKKRFAGADSIMCNRQLQALAIDAWAVDLLPHDHMFILKTGILESLETLSGKGKEFKEGKSRVPSADTERVAHMAQAAIKLLCTNILDCGPTVGSDSTQSALNKLQVKVLEGALNDVEVGLKELGRLGKRLSSVQLTRLHLGHNFCVKPKTVEEKVLSDVLKQSMGEAAGGRFNVVEGGGRGSDSQSLLAQEYIETEERTFQALSLSCTTLGGFASRAGLTFLTSRSALAQMMATLRVGTLRMQRLVLRSLRVLLPRVAPTTADKIAEEVRWGANTVRGGLVGVRAGRFSRSLFLALGSIYTTAQPGKAGTAKYAPFNYRSGQGLLANASDLLSLVRVLGRTTKKAKVAADAEGEGKSSQEDPAPTVNTPPFASVWEQEVRALVDYGLARLPAVVADGRGAVNLEAAVAASDDLACALAAFSLIGGHAPQLVVGGRVENVRGAAGAEEADLSMRETGDLIHLDRIANRCHVRFDHNPSRVVECEASKIRPIEPIPFDPEAFILTEAHLRVFEIFTRVLGEDASKEVARKAEEEKQKEEEELRKAEAEAERKRKESEAASQPWSCMICTYINQPRATACEMCTTPRPQPEKAAGDSTDGQDKKDGEEKAKTTEPEVSEDVLFYRQLRAVALQALCSLMRSERSSQLLIGSSMLPALLRLATQPTALDSYRSVDQLHGEEDRLQELLLQARDGVPDHSRLFKRKAKGNTLDHSPFKGLDVQLPNALDTGSSRAMTFVDDELSTVVFNQAKMIGCARSNHQIPKSLLAYYFEVTIEDEGVSDELASGSKSPLKTDKGATKMKVDAEGNKPEAEKAGDKATSKGNTEPKASATTTSEKKNRPGSWGVALGLFRAGMPMEGSPGSYNSFAFNSSGEVVSTISRIAASEEFGSPFGTGDIIGCGWDLRQRRVYFTRNGARVFRKDGRDCVFENVDGFFHPVVWCRNPGARVSVNFGQRPWAFKFKQTMPAYYLQQLADAEAKGGKKKWKASEAEIRRKTMAEELVVMMGSYPRELCEVALERCQDDMEHAANWLIENGRRELEIMATNAIRASEMLAENKELEAAGVVNAGKGTGQAADDSDDEDLAEWLTGNGNVSGDPNTQRRAAAASFLDDEIEQDVPVGVERKEIRRADSNRDAERERLQAAASAAAGPAGAEDAIETVYDNLKIEDVLPGQLVTVSPLAMSVVGENCLEPGPDREHLRNVAGRTGLVASVEINCKAVQVLFSRMERGYQYCLWLPLKVLLRPTGQWQDPCPLLSGEPWELLAQKYLEVEQALSVRKVRGAVLGLVARSWPTSVPFGLAQLGGARGIMSILQLTAAEMLSTVLEEKAAGSGPAEKPMLEAFKEKIVRLAKEEWGKCGRRAEALPQPSANPEALYKELKDAKTPRTASMLARKSSKPTSPPATDCPLIALLMEECILHFAQAVHHPPPVLVFKSAHPYPSHDEVREEIHIPGASKLLVTFDSRCHLGNDILTRLSFYRDHDYQDLISQNNGRGAARYPSFVIPGDRVWFKFTSGNNNGLWGYKFKVKPIEYRLDDKQALGSHNFELGKWLFELFLEDMPHGVTERYIAELYDAITFYVIHSKPSCKIKGVKLLIQFLLHVHRIPALRLSLLIGRMSRVPDLKKLKPLTQEMDAVMGSLDVHRTIHSRTLQALMELLATADLVQKDFSIGKRQLQLAAPADKKAAVDKEASSVPLAPTSPVLSRSNSVAVDLSDPIKHSVDISRAGGRRIVILEAKYGPDDVTDRLANHVERTGGTELVLPASMRDLKELRPFSIDPEKKKDKRLRVKYRVERFEFVPGDSDVKGSVQAVVVKESLERSILIKAPSKSQPALPEGEPTHIVLSSGPSMFEQVVRISRFTLQARALRETAPASPVAADAKEMKGEEKETKIKQGIDAKVGKAGPTALPNPRAFSKGNIIATDEFLTEAIRLWSLEGSHRPLVPAMGEGKELRPSSTFGFPDPGHFTNQFSATMWLYLEQKAGSTGKPSEKDGSAIPAEACRGLLHKGYHVGTGEPAQHKFGFRRSKADTSRTRFSLTLRRNNALSVHVLDQAGQGHTHVSVKPIPLKRWVHVAVVCRGNTVDIYFDGAFDSKMTLPRPTSGNPEPILLGRPIPGFHPPGVQPPSTSRGGNPNEEDSGTIPSIEGVVKDLRWYVRDLQQKEVKGIIDECTSSKKGKRTSLKDFQLQAPATKGDVKRLKPGHVHGGHLNAIEALCNGRQVHCNGAKDSKYHDVDPEIWEQWHKWTPKMDAQLIRLFSDVAELEQKRKGVAKRGTLPSLLNLSARLVEIPEKLLRTYHLLKGIPVACLRMRFLFIQILNIRIVKVLPMVDFSQALSPWSLAHRLSSLSHLIFLEIKNVAWMHILHQTSTGRGHYVNLNQPRAMKAQERGDRSGRKSVFFQLYLQLHFIKPSVLRTESRPWVVSYQGFGGQDAGGLFRDSVSTICSELHSQWVPLFIPVPNSRDGGVGENQEKWLPCPSCRSQLHISNYAFVGKLMGIAIRGSHMLNLDLPSLVWKPLVGDTVTMSDVKAIDVISCGQIESLSKAGMSGSDITKDNYHDFVPKYFVMVGYDGKEVELKEDGASIPTTWENREEYFSLLKEAKLSEVRPQAQAIRKGLGTIVPIQLLPLFTWQELEMMVCGKREIDIDYLKANTRYRAPVKESDSHVKMLWEVLREFTGDERRLFLRFVWGQSRLPYNPADFKQKFEILSSRDNSNHSLPVSHTCFFSVELPRYTKKSAMREKILYAITNCQSIDTDHAAQNVDWDDES